MGGRGSSSGLKSKSASAAGGGEQPFSVPKFTDAQLKSMSRSQLENVATAIYANNGLKNGKSIADSTSWARSLMSSNTSAQLRKYIKKYNK